MDASARGDKRRILVIEDEPMIGRVCVRALVADGFDVDVAQNGLIAMEMTSNRVYDLCLSDMRTPTMNGLEFFEHLQQRDPALAKRVIFTTGDVMSPDVKAFLGRNPNHFLAKPFTPDELRATVKKALGELS